MQTMHKTNCENDNNKTAATKRENKHDVVYKSGRPHFIKTDFIHMLIDANCEILIWFHIKVDVIHSHHFQFLNQLELRFFSWVFSLFLINMQKKEWMKWSCLVLTIRTSILHSIKFAFERAKAFQTSALEHLNFI